LAGPSAAINFSDAVHALRILAVFWDLDIAPQYGGLFKPLINQGVRMSSLGRTGGMAKTDFAAR
jgi:hypothetical protein